MDPNFNASMMTPEFLAWARANSFNFNPIIPPGNVARNLFPNPPQMQPPQYFSSPISQPHGTFSQADVEFVAETQPDSMPPKKGRSRKGKEAVTGSADATNANAPGRNVQWCENEDLVLLRCYMDVCSDPIYGTNQKYGTLFRKIHEKYEDARRDNLYGLIRRTPDSLRKRVHRIKEEMNHWLSCYERAVKAVGQRSGHNDDDVLEAAQEFHKENTKYMSGFSMFKQWDVLKKYPQYEMYLNWETYLKKKEDQPIDLDDDATDQRESTGGSSGTKRYRLVDDSVSSPQRPMGRDKAKRMAKSSSSASCEMQSISQGWAEFNINYPRHLEVEKKKIEWQMAKEEKKEARKLEKLAMKKEELQIQKRAQLNQKRAQLMELWNNFPNLTAQQRAFADKLAGQIDAEE